MEPRGMKASLLIVGLSVAALLTSVGVAPAVAETTLDEVSIRVQPEYDDPRVLAVMEAKLASDVSLPHTAEFLVPKSAKDPQVGMACEVPDGQGHVCKVFETEDSGDFTSLTYNVEQSRNLFFEYYWDPFTGQAGAAEGEKSFKYEFKAPAPVKTLTIDVQEPRTAEEFKLEPAAASQTEDQEGLKYNTYTFSDVKKDQVVTINASYIKTDPALSSPRSDPNNGLLASQSSGALVPSRSLQTILLGALVVSVGVIVLAVRRSGQSAPAAIGVPISAKRPEKGHGTKFCSACGTELVEGSKFCSDCGAET